MKTLVSVCKFLLVVVFLASPLEGQVSVGAPGVFPRWAACGGYSSSAQIKNLGGTAVDVVMKFYDGNGTAPASMNLEVKDTQGTRTLTVADGTVTLNVAAVASVSTVCSGPQSVIAGAAVFSANDEKVTGTLTFTYPYNGGVLSTSVNVEPSRRGHSVFVNYSNKPGSISSTGFAVVNTGSTTTNVTMNLYDSSKRLIKAAPVVSLAPNANFGKFVEEVFPEVRSMTEFSGFVNLQSTGLTAVMGISSLSDSRGFRMDNFPSSPAIDINGGQANSVMAVAFYPSDVPEDADWAEGLAQVAKGVATYFDLEFSSNNQGSLSETLPWLIDRTTGLPAVGLVRGKKTRAEYKADPDQNGLWERIEGEVRQANPNVNTFFVAQNVDGTGLGWRNNDKGIAFFPAPPMATNGSWAIFKNPEAMIAQGILQDGTKVGAFANPFYIGSHEFGHAVGLPHTLEMEQQYGMSIRNLMRGTIGNVVPSPSTWDWGGLLQKIFGLARNAAPTTLPFTINPVIDGAETSTLVSLLRKN